MSDKSFREEMDAQWLLFDQEAQELKDSYFALDRWVKWYSRQSSTAQREADAVFAEWVLDGNVKKRFDAMALVREFSLVQARANLLKLGAHLGTQDGPVARDEREKALGLAEELTSAA